MSPVGLSELINHMSIILELEKLGLRDVNYWVREGSLGSSFPIGSALGRQRSLETFPELSYTHSERLAADGSPVLL